MHFTLTNDLFFIKIRKKLMPNPTSSLSRERSIDPHTKKNPLDIDMHSVGCIILGGGQGTRLFPLTATRCKPAICFGGRYRLIDVPVSNSINSHCHKIFIVTQFLSSSLHRHIFQTYHVDSFSSSGFIDILSAEQKPNNHAWFQGTADAVRQNVEHFIETPVDYFLILSGDQLYNIDFREMFRFATTVDADLVVASLLVEEGHAKSMGILKINKDQKIINFYEKPQEKHILDQLRASPTTLEKQGFDTQGPKQYLGSMGIYLFKRKALFELLEQDPREDFGKHLIPTKVNQGQAAAYIYDGYWEDIGTIDSFYKANIALTHPNPLFDCYNETNPIYSSRYSLPGPKIFNTQMTNSIICEGSIIEGDEISNSILGPRTVVKKGTIIRDSYLMGNDFYDPPIRNTNRFPEELHIGENCIIKQSIIDKNAWIGNGVQLINKNKLLQYNGDNVFIRDGIIIVMRGAHIPDGFIL
jgi:glucose-1-phosphate adenylyltransferase